jgi:transposase InsO family protein
MPKPALPSAVHLLALALAGWLNRHQQLAIEYLREENRVLREMLGTRRLRFTDTQRRRLAIPGKELGRRLLAGIATLVTPDTILAWHRRLVALKWTYPHRTTKGRRVMRAITRLVLRFATENPRWGYDRIQGALRNVGHVVAPNTIKRILHRNGIAPAPDRRTRTTWRTFLAAHASVIAATDFFTTEVWTARGLVTHYTLFVIDLAARAVEVVGTTASPDAVFMRQTALALTDSTDGFLRAKRFLILDRDSKFTDAFKAVLKDAGVRVVLCPPSSPNCNAFAERWVRSVKEECLDRMIFFGTTSLRRALTEFTQHYNAERNHQGIGNELIAPRQSVGSPEGHLRCRDRLGGMLRYYFRHAA